MAIRSYDLTLDTKNDIMPQIIFGRQGDRTGAVVINGTLTDNNAPIDLTSKRLIFKAKTADGTYVVLDSMGFTITDAVNGKFTYQLPNALWSEAGKIKDAYFSLYGADNVAESTFGLAFVVASAVDMTEDQKEDYITIVDQTLQSLTADIGKLQDQIDTITKAYEAGDFYNKSETDSKDTATLSSAEKYTDNSLSGIVALPEVFINLDAIKSKYPNGANGVMVTADNGHKYIWVNGSWTDAGVYQAVGIANRSVDSLAIKERVLALRTSQLTPWLVDFQNHKLTVSDYSYIYDDTFYQIPKGDYSLSDYATVYLGYDAVKEQFNSYQHFGDLPEDSYFIGIADFTTGQAFLQFDFVTPDAVSNGEFNFAAKIKRANLPAPATGLLSLRPWIVDTFGDAPTITVNGYSGYVVKGTFFEIKSGVYTLDKITSGAYYLYLELDYEKLTAEIKATSSPNSIAPNNPWIGFIETNSYIYRIFDNSDNRYYDYCLITPGKFTVDFDKSILYVPVIWQSVNPLGVSAQNDSVMGINFDNKQSSVYVGLDTSKVKANEMIVIDPDVYKIQKNYHYIGWISINTREYDLGKYGSTHDLATQPWLNKNVACLGDSITEGDSGEGSLIDSYVPKLKKYIGTNAQNFGKSGALITKKTDDDISFVNRVGTIKDQDAVTIFGGINDFQWNAPLGTMADGVDKPTTFFGALKYVITTLAANNPKAKLMLITPMKTTKFQYHTYDNNGNLMQNANGNTQLDFVNAIKQVGEYYSIPVLDMYSNSNYSPYLPSQVGHDNFTVDGLHPTAYGYERIAQTIGHAINAL